MSRTAKERGTVPKSRPPQGVPPAAMLGQMLFETRNQLLAAQADGLVAKTMLAAVLTTVGDVVITPETIAGLQDRPFIIEKSANTDGGLTVRVDVGPEVVDAVVVEEGPQR